MAANCEDCVDSVRAIVFTESARLHWRKILVHDEIVRSVSDFWNVDVFSVTPGQGAGDPRLHAILNCQ